MKVLIADDDDVSAMLLADRMQDLGYEVTVVPDGQQAWNLIESGGYRLLILDWVMPMVDGMELVRRVREKKTAFYTYIILLTGRTQREDRLTALQGGADDFLPKPLDQGELRARLNTARRVLRSEEALRETHSALQHLRRSELRTGGAIQQRLLHTHPPHHTPGLRISSLHIPSQSVDGDFVDYFVLGEVVDVVSADVMGKGVSAALMGAGVKTSLNREMILRLAAHLEVPQPEEIVAGLDSVVTPELIVLQSFLTMCYARFDPRQGRLTYVNCGHPRIFHWVAKEDRFDLLETTTPPLGFVEGVTYEQRKLALEPGDLILLYSDGVTDLPTDSGRWGMSGFAHWAGERAFLPESDLLTALRERRDQAPGDAATHDDLTCVAVRFLGADGETYHRWTDATGLDALRQWVADRISILTPELCREDLGAVLLAVQEAAGNAVRHARQGHEAVPLQAEVFVLDGALRVELRYPGISFDPATVAAPALDGSRDGGFGIAIINRCMDAVRYSHDSGQNLLIMEKRLFKRVFSSG